jgi:hypothetical protein
MGIPNPTLQAASNAIAALGAYICLFTSAAGTTGANEASGGSYTRALTTWTALTTGGTNGSQVNIPCAAATYVEAGVNSASGTTGGTFVGSAAFGGGSVIVSGTGASINVTPSNVT